MCLFLGIESCQEIRFDTGSDVDIRFSADALTFDTVFTQVGSTTRYFKVYNNSSQFARIDRVQIKNSDSRCRFNVDGYGGAVGEDGGMPPEASDCVLLEVPVHREDAASVR